MTSGERIRRLRFLTVLAAALVVLQLVVVMTSTSSASRWLGVLLVVGFTGLGAYLALLWRRETERLREQHFDA
jgi:Flp pilus assembly protein TadB